jgi:ABC-type sugar transport system ATPase subunit
VTLRAKGFAAAIAGDVSKQALPSRVGIGVRPEEIRAAPEQGAATPFPAEVLWVERLGAKSILDVRLGEELVKVVVPPDAPAGRQGPAWLGFQPRADRLLDLETGLFIR